MLSTITTTTPQIFMTRVRCRGKVPEALFRDALRNCEKSHPLFGARIEKSGRKMTWIPAEQTEMPVTYAQVDAEPELPLVTKFNVESERLWCVDVFEWKDENGDDFTDIIVNIHHALCDGLGAIQFISDVAKEIHDLHGKKESEPTRALRNAATDAQALRSRGKFPQTWSDFFKFLPYYYRSVLASVRLIFTRVSSLIPVANVEALMDRPKEFLGYRKIELSPRYSSKLRRHCRKRNTTVNSVVAAELFRAVHDWKMEKEHDDFHALRIMMPFNERSLHDKDLPACNRVSISPFTRKKAEIVDEEKLLASIEKGVRAVKKAKLGINFHRGLWFCKYLMGGLKRLAKTDTVGATCMFANVGNLHAHLGLPLEKGLMKCGPFLIEDVDLIPPIRIGTSFAMTLHEFDGSTRMGIHYDSTLGDRAEFEQFFDYLEERINELAN